MPTDMYTSEPQTESTISPEPTSISSKKNGPFKETIYGTQFMVPGRAVPLLGPRDLNGKIKM